LYISFYRTDLNMKGALLTAAVLLGSAQAGGVHKMKLKKVPLAE
jgi:saccharopepsin